MAAAGQVVFDARPQGERQNALDVIGHLLNDCFALHANLQCHGQRAAGLADSGQPSDAHLSKDESQRRLPHRLIPDSSP